MKPILLVDDSKTVLLYMTSALQKQGYEVVAVEDGESALEVLTHRKDIQFVLSDLMMPGLSGIDLCRVLKSAAFERYIFFVLLSSRNDQGSIVKGIDAGADDFVDKKTSVEELQARIRAGFRTLDLHNMLLARNQELDIAYQTIRQDLESAGDLMRQLLPVELQIGATKLSYSYLPCSQLGGDMLGYAALDEQHVAFYVFDVSGHGVSSALMSFSIQKTLSRSCGPESVTTDLVEGEYVVSEPNVVVERLNLRYQQTPDSQLYFTIVYAVLNTQTGKLRYCTAGHPKFLWRHQSEATIDMVGDENFIVGALAPMQYKDGEITLEPNDSIWCFSDGVVEARYDNELFSVNRLIANVQSVSGLPFEAQVSSVVESIKRWQVKEELDDDLTLLQLQWSGPNTSTCEGEDD